MSDTSPNLDLWRRVETTDPRHTKKFKRAGGFAGTGINSQYTLQRLTETFGPVGGEDTWGYRVLKEELIPVEFAKAGDIDQTSLLHHVVIELWYCWDGKKHIIPYAVGNTMFTSKNKEGKWVVDEEASAKSITDAISKACKQIGFSADIYMGLWDIEGYVEDASMAAVEKILGAAADVGREAFVSAYSKLREDEMEFVKPFLAAFNARVKAAEDRKNRKKGVDSLEKTMAE